MEKRWGGLDFKELAARVISLFGIGIAIWLSLKYLASLWVVLLISWSVAAVIDPIARRIEKGLKIPRKLSAALLVIVLLSLVGGIVFFALNRLWEEGKDLLLWVEEHREEIGSRVSEGWEAMMAWLGRLPFVKDGADLGGESIEETVGKWVGESALDLGAWLSGGVGAILRATPRALIFLVVTVMSCFYLSMDYRNIRDRLIGLLPERAAKGAETFRLRAGRAIRNYLRAYVLLLFLTFCEVFVGLLILGQPYPLLIALGVAIVDILPVLGTGTVLIPWAIVMLVLKNYSVGFGLLILYGVVTIVRQIAEPHLVGGSLGIHPLASLLFMFVGLQLFGVFGLILGPAAALVVKELFFTEGGEDLTRTKG